jgi:hypothetical protein
MVTAQDFIFQRVKDTRNESVAVSTTSLEVAGDMEGKGIRRNIIIRNNSPNAIDIITIVRGSQRAVAGVGIVLKQGEVWYDSTDDKSTCWQYAVQAICATVNGVLAISEE